MLGKRLKKGDNVKVIAGREKGKTGKIQSVIADKEKAQETGCEGQGRYRREGRAHSHFQCDVSVQQVQHGRSDRI